MCADIVQSSWLVRFAARTPYSRKRTSTATKSRRHGHGSTPRPNLTDAVPRTTSRAAGGAHRDAAAAARRLDGGDRGGPLQRAPRPGGGPPDPTAPTAPILCFVAGAQPAGAASPIRPPPSRKQQMFKIRARTSQPRHCDGCRGSPGTQFWSRPKCSKRSVMTRCFSWICKRFTRRARRVAGTFVPAVKAKISSLLRLRLLYFI